MKDISTPWEGEASAEPQAFIGPRKTMRLGGVPTGSLALPSARITNWVVLLQLTLTKIVHGVARQVLLDRFQEFLDVSFVVIL